MWPIRNFGEPPQPLEELYEGERDHGYLLDPLRTRLPVCVRGTFDLGMELQEAGGGVISEDPADVRAVLHRDRQCPDWFPYQPGLSPEKHLDQMFMIQMEQARREHDRRLADMEREIQQKNLEISQALQASNEATRRFTTNWTYAAFFVALAALVLTVLIYVHSLGPQPVTISTPTPAVTTPTP